VLFIYYIPIGPKSSSKIPKALVKMGSAPYPLSALDHFLHLGIFAPYMQLLDLKLTTISTFNANLV
jgi:hypothetical protein